MAVLFYHAGHFTQGSHERFRKRFLPVFLVADATLDTACRGRYPREKNVMGYSMRTDRYRYAEWVQRPVANRTATAPAGHPMEGTVVGFELYDHQSDPDENVNLAGKPEFKASVTELSRRLRDGWRAAAPE